MGNTKLLFTRPECTKTEHVGTGEQGKEEGKEGKEIKVVHVHTVGAH